MTTLRWLIAALIAAVAAVVYFFDPATSSFYPGCPLYSLTGLQCASCGATRAAHQLLHGHFAEALQLNPVFVVLGPLIAGSAMARPRIVTRPWFVLSVVTVLLVWMVVRNTM